MKRIPIIKDYFENWKNLLQSYNYDRHRQMKHQSLIFLYNIQFKSRVTLKRQSGNEGPSPLVRIPDFKKPVHVIDSDSNGDKNTTPATKHTDLVNASKMGRFQLKIIQAFTLPRSEKKVEGNLSRGSLRYCL